MKEQPLKNKVKKFTGVEEKRTKLRRKMKKGQQATAKLSRKWAKEEK